eukprot:m.191302 g.191302  ORF g.191302 m.191302 type:complete len:169 (+) comp18589_c0_seq1:360-866(+)
MFSSVYTSVLKNPFCAELLRRCIAKQTTVCTKYNSVRNLPAKLIGMPSEDHIAKIDGNAEKWVRTALAGMVRRPFADLPQFRGPSNETPDAEAMDLLERLLQYDPDVRPTAEEALRHPFFSEYHVPTDEPIAAQPFDKAFEKLKLDAAGWKEMCMREIAEFRRNPPKF